MMTPAGKRQALRSVDDLREALEDLYNRQRDGQLDAKASDGMNTTIKGAIYLNVTLPLKAFDIYVKSQIKKVAIPEGLRKALPLSVD